MSKPCKKFTTNKLTNGFTCAFNAAGYKRRALCLIIWQPSRNAFFQRIRELTTAEQCKYSRCCYHGGGY
ncbi:MAG: hypothetical protein A2143_09240 [Gallionellales bacterium RBG_16_57_15]|nr:MAG: hypothetical protein A2143_09240 [Gallionellales bacterium RBG_16_57_15]